MDAQNLVDTLNDLIKTSKDGEYGFKTSAGHATSPELKRLFSERAAQCQQAAAELQTLVLQHGGEPDDSGSVIGAMHRGWVSVRGSLTGTSDQSMLNECERAEDAALARYREALKDSLDNPLPAPVREVVQRQLEGVRRNHDQIKMLRERTKTASL